MKINTSRQDLFNVVNKVKSVVASKSALPILSHVLVQASDGQVKLSATDLKVSIECFVDCEVEREGSMTVASHLLASILSELPDSEISIELSDNNVIMLDCGSIHTKLFSMSPDEFPAIREFEGVEPLTFPQEFLRKLFSKTSFSICTDQARYNLTGLLFEIRDGLVIVVATDGRRMSLYKEQSRILDELNVRVIIPGKMIYELERLLGNEGDVEIYLDESQVAFSFENTRLVSALIEGNFPNYDMIIPKKHDKIVVVETVQLSEAMRRTRTMTNEKFNTVRLQISEDRMLLRVVTPEVGEYEEEVPVQYDGEDIDVAFNPAFVAEILRHIEEEKTSFVLKDGGNPGLIKPFKEEGPDNYLNVVMPIRV